MQEIPRTSTDLAHEGFDEALKRLEKLENILSRIRQEADRIPECGSIRAILREVPDAQ